MSQNYNEIIETEILVGIDKAFHKVLAEMRLSDNTENSKQIVRRTAAELKFRVDNHIKYCFNAATEYLDDIKKVVKSDEYGGIRFTYPDYPEENADTYDLHK